MSGWLQRFASELGVDALTSDEIGALLDLTRDVAHGTERRFAPLTAFLVGVAVADEDGDRETAVERAANTIRTVLPDDAP